MLYYITPHQYNNVKSACRSYMSLQLLEEGGHNINDPPPHMFSTSAQLDEHCVPLPASILGETDDTTFLKGGDKLSNAYSWSLASLNFMYIHYCGWYMTCCLPCSLQKKIQFTCSPFKGTLRYLQMPKIIFLQIMGCLMRNQAVL